MLNDVFSRRLAAAAYIMKPSVMLNDVSLHCLATAACFMKLFGDAKRCVFTLFSDSGLLHKALR